MGASLFVIVRKATIAGWYNIIVPHVVICLWLLLIFSYTSACVFMIANTIDEAEQNVPTLPIEPICDVLFTKC